LDFLQAIQNRCLFDNTTTHTTLRHTHNGGAHTDTHDSRRARTHTTEARAHTHNRGARAMTQQRRSNTAGLDRRSP
jgi:hypothetical protein